MTNKNNDCESKREKLCGFENWPQYADFTQAMLKEKEVWDFVDGSCADHTTAAQTRKKMMKNVVASTIIKQRINFNLYINIIGE